MSDETVPPLPADLAALFAKASEAADPALDDVASQVRENVERMLVLRGLSDPSESGGGENGGGASGSGEGAGGGSAASGTNDAGGTAAKATTGLVSKGLVTKFAITSALVGALVGGAIGVRIGAANAPRSERTNLVVAPTANVAPSNPKVDTADSVPVVDVSALRLVPSAPPPAPSSSTQGTADSTGGRSELKQERELVDAAGASLRAGHPGQALLETERHLQRFPAGQLAEEREVIAIQALVALGRKDEAKARVERFKRRFSGSPQQKVLDRLLE